MCAGSHRSHCPSKHAKDILHKLSRSHSRSPSERCLHCLLKRAASFSIPQTRHLNAVRSVHAAEMNSPLQAAESYREGQGMELTRPGVHPSRRHLASMQVLGMLHDRSEHSAADLGKAAKLSSCIGISDGSDNIGMGLQPGTGTGQLNCIGRDRQSYMLVHNLPIAQQARPRVRPRQKENYGSWIHEHPWQGTH